MKSTFKTPLKVLPILVISQFAGTSLWFAGNAVLSDLTVKLQLSQYAVSLVTASVVLGFVTGTLVFAFLSLADRFSPVKLFFYCSLAGAVVNSAMIWLVNDAIGLFTVRFIVGFFIAGIYPVGMKIAADWFEKGLGKAMGFLIGALVLGTAFPHLLKNRDFDLPWRDVIICTSAFAAIGGLMMLSLGNGPYRKISGKFQWNSIPQIFKSLPWRRSAYGYFGHMWELYSFWAFVPLMLNLYSERSGQSLDISFWSFLIIAIGSLGCVVGGYLSQKLGSATVALIALLSSVSCCFLSPFFYELSFGFFLLVMIFWGFTVIPDSPQFSTMVAQYAPPHLRGTALTIYNSIGFSITLVSLLVIDRVFHSSSWFGGEKTFLLVGLITAIGLPSAIQLVLNSKKTANNS